MIYCNVIVTRPFNQYFTYKAEDSLKIKVGHVVSVPFGKKNDQLGVVFEILKKPKNIKYLSLKEIVIIHNSIILNKDIIKFIKWVSDYTLAPLGSVLKLFLINNQIVSHNYKTEETYLQNPKLAKLNTEQEKVFKSINENFFNKPIPLFL